MTGVRERTAVSRSDRPSMPRPVPSSVTIVRSLGMHASFHGTDAGPKVPKGPPGARMGADEGGTPVDRKGRATR